MKLNLNHSSSGHTWRFFRAGGFDQVRLDSGEDLQALGQLDQKLWVALSCPTRGLEFDAKTLDLIDTDQDGRIRAPEILAAVQWACAMLKAPEQLVKSAPTLPLHAINDANPEGRQLGASARQILSNLGKSASPEISIADTTDTARIFAQTKFNGDGIVPIDSAADPAAQAVIADIIACLGAETDRSGKPGVNQAKVDRFFTEAQAFSDWWTKAENDRRNILPLGDATLAAAAALNTVQGKIDDYFTRCRLASFDARATAALNVQEAEYLALAAQDLSVGTARIAALPLARIEPGQPLPLARQVNPAWAEALGRFHDLVVRPILGDQDALSASTWADLTARFAAYHAWMSAQAGALVEKLGLPRIREILAGNYKNTITDLILRDKELEPQANAIAAVDRLVRYHRDLYQLLCNYVNFRDFYTHKGKAIFQAGTLYLDQRACDLCIRVDDLAKHGLMAHLSRAYLAYCDLTRKSTGEKMTIVAAFTAGNSDNLMVGRNGIFYDRSGYDWDATITKIVDNPISIRQAFWAPYKRLIRWVEDQIAKRAQAAESVVDTDLQALTSDLGTATTTGKAPGTVPGAGAGAVKKMDIGTIAALSVAFGFIATAFATILSWMTPYYFVPVYIGILMLVISLPSMFIAAMKLRQRNLGPLLDANGWAVNAKAKVNIPFGGSLTSAAALPPGSKLDLIDPYADSKRGRNAALAAAVLAAILWGLWYFGVIEMVAPDVVPVKSSFVEKREARAKAQFLHSSPQPPASQPVPPPDQKIY